MKRGDIYILGGKRTPFCEWAGGKKGNGNPGGALKNISALNLGTIALKGALKHLGIEPGWIENIVFGNAEQTGTDAIFGARFIGLKAGLPREIPALTINRICGTGHEAVRQGALAIMTGDANNLVAVGGTENLSQAPYAIRKSRDYFNLKDYLKLLGKRAGPLSLNEWLSKIPPGVSEKIQIDDLLWTFLRDPYSLLLMAETAEKLGKLCGVTRHAADLFALRSHELTKKAVEGGAFSEEIVPVEIPGQETVYLDDHFATDCTFEKLSQLPPVFAKDGLVTAGNASGIVDGAAALILASKKAIKHYNLEPLGRIVSWGIVGVDPSIMGIGPVPASQQALKKAGLKKEQIDLWEINEAFSCQYLAVEKALELNRWQVNISGGAIGIGHPFAATGARQILTLLLRLRNQGKCYGLATACIGGGQGIAIIVEAL